MSSNISNDSVENIIYKNLPKLDISSYDKVVKTLLNDNLSKEEKNK